MVALINYCLTNLLFFNIPLLFYYTNLNSSIACCLSSGDIYLFLGTSFGLVLSAFDSLFRVLLETFVILSAILLPIKSPVASPVF